jgi:AcrR family transcriptional regulator
MSAESKAPRAQARPGTAGMGLRERKKERTRRTIRTEAFRLFREHGYAETTVEQIAAAADISPSTFFRYFPSKEQVVLTDDLDPIMIRALDAQPAELSPLQALRQAVIGTYTALDDEEFAFERERVRLLFSLPELRGIVLQETQRNVELISGLIARRTGHPADALEVRAFAGALTGALLTVIGPDGGFDLDRTIKIIDFLEAGMPL